MDAHKPPYTFRAAAGMTMTRTTNRLLCTLNTRMTHSFGPVLVLLALALQQAKGTEAPQPVEAAKAAASETASPVLTKATSLHVRQAPPVTTCNVFRVRPQDEVWAVSTRCLGCPPGRIADPNFTVWHYQGSQWMNSSTAQFHGTSSPDVVTVFFIHGNRIDSTSALQNGLDVYFQMAGKFDAERPVRFVIWSWPSEQIHGPLKDVRIKAARTDVDACYLARFLSRIDSSVPVGLVGYSYGARIICGGLHLLGGGQLIGHTVEPGPRPPMRVALWAAAEHSEWLAPGYYHGRALPMADRWLITVNGCDPVLRRYHMLDKGGKPSALGYAGLYGRNLMSQEMNRRVEEMNVSHLVGGTHEMRPYLYSLAIQNCTRDYVLWYEPNGLARGTGPALATTAP